MLRGLESRYLFTGDLVLQTPLHIGGGDTTLGTTDSPVLRTAEGQPFIPGSSLKGAFRSMVEKLAMTLELPHMDWNVLDLGSERMKTFHRRRRGEIDQYGNEIPPEKQQQWTEEETVQHVAKEWPVTAQLFGNPYTASKIFFADALLQGDPFTNIQRRDGVAIDRDSERAMDTLKYDYEVVPPTLRFGFELLLENPTSTELSVTCLGLAELLSGFFGLGGKRSSGMGRCTLEEFQVYQLDLASGDRATRTRLLQRYLTGKTWAEKFEHVQDSRQFVDTQIARLVAEVS